MTSTRVNEADYRFTVLRDRLIAAASGQPAQHQGIAEQRRYRADRREYLRNWEITITNNTRAQLVYLDNGDAVGGLVPPAHSHDDRVLPANHRLGVVISLHGHDIAVMTRTSLTLSMEHGYRTVVTARRMRSILFDNAPGVRLGTEGADNHGSGYDTHLWTTWVSDPQLAEPGHVALVTNPQHPLIGPEGFQSDVTHEMVLASAARQTAAPYQWLMTHPGATHPTHNDETITRLDVMSPAHPTVTILGEMR